MQCYLQQFGRPWVHWYHRGTLCTQLTCGVDDCSRTFFKVTQSSGHTFRAVSPDPTGQSIVMMGTSPLPPPPPRPHTDTHTLSVLQTTAFSFGAPQRCTPPHICSQ